jgi:hypothetical protein
MLRNPLSYSQPSIGNFYSPFANSFVSEMPYTDVLPYEYREDLRSLYPECYENNSAVGGVPNRALLLRQILEEHQKEIDKLYDAVPERREGKSKELFDAARESLLTKMIEKMGNSLDYLEGYTFREDVDSRTASEVIGKIRVQLKILEKHTLNLVEKEGGPFIGGRFSLSAQALKGYLAKTFKNLFTTYDANTMKNDPKGIVEYILGEIDKLRLLGELRIVKPGLYKDWINMLQAAQDKKEKSSEIEELLQGMAMMFFTGWERYWGISSKIANEQLAAIFEAMQFHFIIQMRDTLLKMGIIVPALARAGNNPS